MIEKIVEILEKKSLILSLPDASERQELGDAIGPALTKTGFEVFGLKSHLKDMDKYFAAVRAEFPILNSPTGVPKERMSLDQLKDCHLNWLVGKKKVAILIPEGQKLLANAPSFFFELLGMYLTESYLFGGRILRVLITLDGPIDVRGKLSLFCGTQENESPTTLFAKYFEIL